jgi:hypothetical protein
MKCFKHASVEAIALCRHCGRAVCHDCIPDETVAQIVCSEACALALARDAKAVQMVLDKSTQNAKASAFYCYLTSGLSAAAAVAAWFMLPSPFLIYFTGACALVLFAAGFWYSRAAKQ